MTRQKKNSKKYYGIFVDRNENVVPLQMFPGGENRAHRPTHKISSADKIYKRSFFTDFYSSASWRTGNFSLKALRDSISKMAVAVAAVLSGTWARIFPLASMMAEPPS